MNTDEDSEGDLWKLVYNAVFNGLTKATETHHYSDIDNIPQAAIICREQDKDHPSTPQAAIICREQDKDHPSTPHPATIKCQKGKWKWTCTKSQQCGGKVSGNIPWLNLLPLGTMPSLTGESGMQPQLVQQNPPQLQLANASQQHTSPQLCQQVISMHLMQKIVRK